MVPMSGLSHVENLVMKFDGQTPKQRTYTLHRQLLWEYPSGRKAHQKQNNVIWNITIK